MFLSDISIQGVVVDGLLIKRYLLPLLFFKEVSRIGAYIQQQTNSVIPYLAEKPLSISCCDGAFASVSDFF